MCDHIKRWEDRSTEGLHSGALGLHSRLCPVAGGRVFLCVGTCVYAGVRVGVSVGVCVRVYVCVGPCEQYMSYIMSGPGPGAD